LTIIVQIDIADEQELIIINDDTIERKKNEVGRLMTVLLLGAWGRLVLRCVALRQPASNR